MPSPFPGVHPYVEAHGEWGDFHHRLVTFLASYLTPLLKPNYVARIDRHVFMLRMGRREIVPDVSIRKGTRGSRGSRTRRTRSLVEADTTVAILEPQEDDVVEVRQGFIRIKDKRSDKRLVAQIEVLSPVNKAGDGLKQYRRKQREVLRSDVHLVEIDLLLRGRHVAAVPEELLQDEVPDWHYLVAVNRYPTRRRHDVCPFRMQDRLPRVRVPLANGDADVVIDLGSIYDRCYDDAAYDADVDYRQAPPGMRHPEHQLAWVDQLLRKAGHRVVSTR